MKQINHIDLYLSKTYIEDLVSTSQDAADIKSLCGSSILITGCTGTIGSWLADTLILYNELNAADMKIILAGRNIKRMKAHFEKCPTTPPDYVYFDLGEAPEWDFPVDYIIHAAGNAHPAAFNGDPCGTITGNILGTWNLLKYGLDHGCKRFLYISTGEVYGQGDLSLESFEETNGGYVDPTSPRSSYPNSKRAAETLCASFTAQYGMETVIVRPSHTYGPCVTPTDSRANVQFLKNGFDGSDIAMKSAGTQERSYTYVADCASAALTVLLKGKKGNAYNSAVPEARATIAEFAQAVANASGTKVIFADPTEADLANRTPIAKQVLSSAKTESLGWRGRYDVKTGVSHTLKIWRESHCEN